MPGVMQGRAAQVAGESVVHDLGHACRAPAQSEKVWQHSEDARPRIRVIAKKLPHKHGYPPDMRGAAVRLVLEQAEAQSAQWAA